MSYPTLPSGDQPPAPLAPTVSPASQSYAVPLGVDVSLSSGSLVFSNGESQRRDMRAPDAPSVGVTVTPSSAALVNSNGDAQRPIVDHNQAASSGVTVTRSAPLSITSNGEQQRLSMEKPDVAIPTGTGLPANVFADSQNLARSMPPQVAQVTSPAVTVDANTSSRSGLPVNVHIR